MSATRHFKLGLFAIAAVASAVVAAFGLGIHRRSATVSYHTYFDESVQGLDIGAPVKYRGVRIGSVSAISIAPDRKRVEVSLSVEHGEAQRLGLGASAPGIRTQLASQGITGVKFIDIDFIDPATNPPPQLPFPVEQPYIPSRASLFKGLQDNLEAIGPRLPELVEHGVAALGKLELVLDDFREEQLPHRLATAIDSVGDGVLDVRRLVQDVSRARLPAKAGATLDRLNSAADRFDAAVARLDGPDGLLASARRATDSFGDVGVALRRSPAQLDRALRELGEAATAIRELVDMIDREPDMLVKGRARTKSK